jgi:hypothetical protein
MISLKTVGLSDLDQIYPMSRITLAWQNMSNSSVTEPPPPKQAEVCLPRACRGRMMKREYTNTPRKYTIA